jgi:sirohydrochlorin cobaltochelatase
MKASSKSVIVLAMHGEPATDFPRDELEEYFSLQGRWARGTLKSELLCNRCREIEDQICRWPRTAFNDPLFSGAKELAAWLEMASGREVILGFNEFCFPSLEDALNVAAEKSKKVIVITPWLIRGEDYAERDIPAAVQAARENHPLTLFVYVWPFESRSIADFLAAQVALLK